MPRLASIDVLRALTMLLMIFVNDLWSLHDIPLWLEHTAAKEDGMGLADVVFPAFLVIVGMSTPFAVASRRAKGETTQQIFIHIISRAFALIVMGVFLVNGETINANATGIPRWIWFPLSCLCFILIWNSYPKSMNKTLRISLQTIGALVLITMAILYKGGDNGSEHFATSWWGILGLIGWAYLAGSLAYLFLGHSLVLMILFWAACLSINIANHAELLTNATTLRVILSPFGEGAMPAFVAGGTICSMLFSNYRNDDKNLRVIGLLLALGGILCIAGFALRPLHGISKIQATPSWVLICTAITFAAFAFVYWLVDIKKRSDLFNIIKPAGTNTLTVYLLPYFAYAILNAFSIQYPDVISSGAVGLLKSFLFALLIVIIGGKIPVKVKL
ncbi:MAG: DUF5009 domain-containing protein [Chitinophagaceae bacterium]|nr:MAG: DUF5009 domain-containing protein [Chitinophagaceae bacterium]